MLTLDCRLKILNEGVPDICDHANFSFTTFQTTSGYPGNTHTAGYSTEYSGYRVQAKSGKKTDFPLKKALKNYYSQNKASFRKL